MRDRSLFTVVLALVAGAFLWPGAPRRAEQSAAGTGAPSAATSASASAVSLGARADAARRVASRHGGPHPHVSSAMLLLLAEYLALDPHPEADRGKRAPASAGAEAEAKAEAGGGDADPESDLTDAQADRLGLEIRDAVDASGLTIDPLIATLPDPIESHAKWMFDRYLDGLSRGITASGYVMDRFGPESWWTASGAQAAADGGGTADTASTPEPLHHHEGEPGVVLFRTTDGKRLLVLLIVTETATAGVHAHAMMTALDSAANLVELQRPRIAVPQSAAATARLGVAARPSLNVGGDGAGAGVIAGACCSPSADHTLKLVGPTFSGSAVSLRTAVERWLALRDDGCWGLRIVSGSISSVISRNTLAVWDKRVTFQATVPDDDALQDALFTYLKRVNGGHGEPVAWIVEDNTTYGASWNPSAKALVDKTAREPKSVARRAMFAAAAAATAVESAAAASGTSASGTAAAAPPAADTSQPAGASGQQARASATRGAARARVARTPRAPAPAAAGGGTAGAAAGSRAGSDTGSGPGSKAGSSEGGTKAEVGAYPPRPAAPAGPNATAAPAAAGGVPIAGGVTTAAACRVDAPDAPDPRVTPGDDFERIVIPFPMHVSRLHSAAEDERAQGRSKNTFGPQPIVPLHLADSGSPRDAFPAMTPELTFASVEIALAALLDTIHTEHIRLVAIMATDTRDKLFLAEQIARRVPDALLFTLTTDILYLHPDVNDNVRGMIIASSYPLNPVTQPWTPHDANRVLQMQHNSAQGIYNATVALLGSIGTETTPVAVAAPVAAAPTGAAPAGAAPAEAAPAGATASEATAASGAAPEAAAAPRSASRLTTTALSRTVTSRASGGAAATVSNNVAPLLDYGAPGPIRGPDDEVTGPAIWISSVGRDTFWPVAIFDTRDSRPPLESFADARLIKVRTSRVPRYPVPHLSLSPWACALFVGLVSLALLHVGAYALEWRRQRYRRDVLGQADMSAAATSLHWLARAFRAAPPEPSNAATAVSPAQSAATSASTLASASASESGSAASGSASASASGLGSASGSASASGSPSASAPIVWNDCAAAHRRAPITVYQLVCVLALWTFLTIPMTLSVIWLKAAIEADAPVSSLIVNWTAAAIALIAWAALTALAGALLWTLVRRASPRQWLPWREARGWPATVRVLLWTIGLAAIAQCTADVLAHLPLTQIGLWQELPYFMRVTTLGNGVSPVVTYFLLAAAFYAWGLVNLRRLATPTPMLCVSLPEGARARDWRLALLRGLGFPDPAAVLTQFQCRSTDAFLAVPAVGPLIALTSAVVIYVIILGPAPLTIEGPTFGFAIVAAMIVLHVVTGLAIFQFYLLWRLLHAFLEQLSHDGLLDAFEKLGKRHVRVISAGISLRGPRDIDTYLAEHTPALARAMVPETATAAEKSTAAANANAGPAGRHTASAAQAQVQANPIGDSVSRENIPPAVWAFLTERAVAASAQDEDVTVATLLAFAIQQILTRLGELLAFATVSTLLVITAFATFPFGRGAVLDGFGWLYVFILTGTALLVFVQVARDPILGRLKGYDKPGAFNWDRDILTKLALYAGVPLLGFITSQFPWLGHVLGQWLQPMQQALPWQ
jgi:hypothetical protein